MTTSKNSSNHKSKKLSTITKAQKNSAKAINKIAHKRGAAQTVAKSAAGVAIAATAIAAGAAMTSKTYRQNVLKSAEKAYEGVIGIASEIMSENKGNYQPIQHSVKKKSSSTKVKKVRR